MKRLQLKEVRKLQRKAAKEAQKAVDKVYSGYNKEMKNLIAEALPEGTTLTSGNGMCWIRDKEGNELISGRAWVHDGGDGGEQMIFLSLMKYNLDFQGTFSIDQVIKSKKSLK